jgi:hypothetical protein
MKISQFNLQYISLQDRLLLRMNSATAERVEFWITRRYLIALWGVLLQVLGADKDVLNQQDSVNKQSVLAFKRQKNLSGIDTKKPFNADPVTHWPLGDTPLLLSKIQIRRLDTNQQSLWLGDARDVGLALPLSESLPHLLTHLITQTHAHSGWQIEAITRYQLQADQVVGQAEQVN